MKKLQIFFVPLAIILWVFLAYIQLGTVSHQTNAQQSSSSPNAMPSISGQTASCGGSLLIVGGTTICSATVGGASIGSPCIATASDGTNMMALGLTVHCDVTSANTATVTLYAIISLTPVAKTYNVRVPQ